MLPPGRQSSLVRDIPPSRTKSIFQIKPRNSSLSADEAMAPRSHAPSCVDRSEDSMGRRRNSLNNPISLLRWPYIPSVLKRNRVGLWFWDDARSN